MSIPLQTAQPRVRVSLHSRLQKTPRTPSSTSPATIGKDASLKFARTATHNPADSAAEVLVVVVDLVAVEASAVRVEASAAASMAPTAVEQDMVEATAEAAEGMEEAVMVAVEASVAVTVLLYLVPLPPTCRLARTPLSMALFPAASQARPSM